MSRKTKNVPKADMLMGSMRSMGYTFEAAVADIIDNSISAHCTSVRVLFPVDPLSNLCVGILDNGDGMTAAELVEAMRYGSSSSETIRRKDDLGRFGLGLKSASLSQCRVLTVISKKDGGTSACTWDYDFIKEEKDWTLLELTDVEIGKLPYADSLDGLENGTLVLWRRFDVLSKANDGQVYETLNKLKGKVHDHLALIFHRFLGRKITMYVNNKEVKPLDPFLESNPKTTMKKECSVAMLDSTGTERHIMVKPYVLPYITDLTEKDRKLLGGTEQLRARQGFYVYRNDRLIIWGTWFGMKQRSELTKNARIRVDIPNTLDDIWSIDIKKQTASLPSSIQNQLKRMVEETLDTSVRKETHRGRKESNDDIDYIWDRMEGRNKSYYYRINRDSALYRMVREKMNEDDFAYFDMFMNEVEKNLPVQQIYIDKSNNVLVEEGNAHREDDVCQTAITMIEFMREFRNDPAEVLVCDLMKAEPFCKYPAIKEKLLIYYQNECDGASI